MIIITDTTIIIAIDCKMLPIRLIRLIDILLRLVFSIDIKSVVYSLTNGCKAIKLFDMLFYKIKIFLKKLQFVTYYVQRWSKALPSSPPKSLL